MLIHKRIKTIDKKNKSCDTPCQEIYALALKVGTIDGKVIVLMAMIAGSTIFSGGQSWWQQRGINKRMDMMETSIIANTEQMRIALGSMSAMKTDYSDQIVLIDRDIDAMGMLCCDDDVFFGFKSEIRGKM